ncbi:MAG: ABC transporter permease [Dysgonamonadaceae bacterium]|jgi:ABC-2 type transport system permease protein|nr:ABC transporter permease [Dysgonamonadaceae bacterium]
MLRYLIEKEFKQTFRNAFIPKLICAFPFLVLLVFPWATNQEIRNINVTVIDRDHSAWSKRLSEKISASTYFNLVGYARSNDEGMLAVEDGTADMLLDIPPGFEKNLVNGGETGVMISANAVNIMKGGLGSGYMNEIIRDFAGELRGEIIQTSGKTGLPLIQVIPQGRFNTFSDYKVFMIPALIVILMTLLCGFLPALNIVGEKETGTIEQINVTPVSKFSFILGKLIPYWAVGLFVFTLALGLSALIYGLTPQSNLLTLYLSVLVYITTVSGLGLLISNYSSTMQQAMFVIFFFLIIFLLISGLFTPIASMPHWAQVFSCFNPLRYFIEIMRMTFLKGSGFSDIWRQLAALAIYASVLNGWALVGYRKSR